MASCLLFVLGVITVASALSFPYHSETAINKFKEFVVKHDKKYSSEIEEAFRFGMFLKNLDFIDHLNKHSKYARYGITNFADMAHEEVISRSTGLMKSGFGGGCQPNSAVGEFNITDGSFDWRDQGVVGPVRQQGNCASCWAFSAIGNVESINAIKTKNFIPLSEQQLVDCETSSHGCSTGFPDNALSYLITNGAMSYDDYPYTAAQGTCQYDASKVSVRINNCYSISVPENDLAEKLQQLGPLSIAIDSSALHVNYNGGIIHGDECQGSAANHAVLLVGYSEEGGVPYWIFKNSWGSDWGDGGYFKLQKGVNCLLMANGPIVTAA